MFQSANILCAMVCFAYANGANDNFKGVATLFGSGVVTLQARWRMISTILGAWATTLPLGALLGGLAYWCTTVVDL